MLSREAVIGVALDEVAERVLQRRSGRRVSPFKIRMVLRRGLAAQHGLVSFKVKAADDPVIIAYFDVHPRFTRVSDTPEWEPV